MSEKIIDHQIILADRVRLEAYRSAIFEVVKKGDVVVDLGTGSGILALFAARAGAKRVYAIEQDDIIEQAKQVARSNHLKEKIVFVKGQSDKVSLPEKADVVLSELIGSLGFEENLYFLQLHARDRFLRPGGRMIPGWMELFFLPVESNNIWQDTAGLWDGDFHGFDFSLAREDSVNRRYVLNCSSGSQGLARPVMLTRLDFMTMIQPELIFGKEVSIETGGTFHGFVGFFRAGLSGAVLLSNGPDAPETHWKQNFFPLKTPISVEIGDVVRCRVKAIPLKNNLFWEWRTTIRRKDNLIADYRQSDLDISIADLTVGTPEFKPILNMKGILRRRILNLCDGNRIKEDIARQLLEEFPDRFPGIEASVAEVIRTLRTLVDLERAEKRSIHYHC